MRTRVIWTAVACALTVAAVASVAFASGAPSVAERTETIKVIEHPVNEALTDTGTTSDSAGDILTFHNPLFDGTNSHVVGHDQGTCFRISPRLGSWECSWTNFLPGGHITVEGPFFDAHDSTVAVTGGTGIYRNVTGEMRLRAVTSGFVFAFTIRR